MKKKIVNRIGAVLCALVVLFSSLSVGYYLADEGGAINNVNDFLVSIGLPEFASYNSDYSYYLNYYSASDSTLLFEAKGDSVVYVDGSSIIGCMADGEGTVYKLVDNVWKSASILSSGKCVKLSDTLPTDSPYYYFGSSVYTDVMSSAVAYEGGSYGINTDIGGEEGEGDNSGGVVVAPSYVNLSFSESSFYDEYAYEGFVQNDNYCVAVYDGCYTLIAFDYLDYWYRASDYELRTNGGQDVTVFYLNNGLWDRVSHGYGGCLHALAERGIEAYGYELSFSWPLFETHPFVYIYSTCEIKEYDKTVVCSKGWKEGWSNGAKVDTSLGYLKNIKVKNEYLRGGVDLWGTTLPLYYDDATDSLKKVWTFDKLTTTDLDLSGGGYSVRHYVKEATVKGYKESDIVEMSDMYLVGEYDASTQRIEYLEKDHDAKLEELGYDGLGFVEKYLQGYFQLEHHYFLIVNNETGEVGCYLHVYPKNEDGTIGTDFVDDWDSGTELGYEGLDENMDVDEDAPSGTVDEKDGYGETYEEAEEDAEEDKIDLGKFEGDGQFVKALKTFTKSVGNVSSAIGSIIELFPPWMLLSFTVAFALLILSIVLRSFKG